jgi:hypothetical protein
MGGVNGDFLDESVRVTYPDFAGGSAAAAAAEVAKLERPWIAEEGPMTADFRRHLGGELALAARGLAFDELVTVQWDEDAVWVIEPHAAESGVLAREVEILVHQHFRDRATAVRRIDYLRHGVLLASRYLPAGSKGEADA